ncbi:hypothetical protein KGF54_004428 [Candida jiufengensis]|uniref:uncharacterized protein n=1 Tax=Candida jiufengensis TaxID=497108 RepID=UPI002225AFFC|nr:uncharacterized protein KGF54_004428 [Candida jiufengensis]KAI5951354.1 hypothetical protein KGF54_004428 [Candida jiufengensis]
MNMKTPLKQYTASLYRQSAKWLTTPYENPTKSNLKIALTLRNVFIWLILINILNYNLKNVINFGNIDIVQVLDKKSNQLLIQSDESDLTSKKYMENLLIGIYMRNEETYLKNINHTTVYSRVVFELNDYEIELRMYEGLVNSERFKDQNQIHIASVINWALPSKFPIFDLRQNQNMISNFCNIHLNKLYPLNSNHEVIIKRINETYQNLIIGKFIILINSIIILVTHILIFYCPKRLSFHYLNLSVLYFMNFFNLILILMMIISRQKITSIRDSQLGLLIIELFSILSFNLIFYQSHETIMNTFFVQFTPTASSIYSDKEVETDTRNLQHDVETGNVNEAETPSTTAGLTGRTATKNLRAHPNVVHETINNSNAILKNLPKSPYEYKKTEYEQRRSATAPILSSTGISASPNYTQV